MSVWRTRWKPVVHSNKYIMKVMISVKKCSPEAMSGIHISRKESDHANSCGHARNVSHDMRIIERASCGIYGGRGGVLLRCHLFTCSYRVMRSETLLVGENMHQVPKIGPCGHFSNKSMNYHRHIK